MRDPAGGEVSPNMEARVATWREWLTELGFDWDAGRIVYQPVADDAAGDPWSTPGWSSAESGEFITPDHEVLDREFGTGFGGPQAPRIVAEDGDAVYYVSQYDGATRPHKIIKGLEAYTGDDPIDSPYPGGG